LLPYVIKSETEVVQHVLVVFKTNNAKAMQSRSKTTRW